MERRSHLAALGLALASLAAVAADAPPGALTKDTGVRPPPPPAGQPGLHAPFTDPVFGTRIQRVTDPSQWPGISRMRHYYSKMQPFNADDTRAILFGDGRQFLYDAKAWLPLKELRIRTNEPEIQWHPTDPNLFYYLDAIDNTKRTRAMYLYDIRDDATKLLHEFREYDSVRARGEGNMDRAGRYYAMVGARGKELEAIVYDVAGNKVAARMPVTEAMVSDWISMSPTGRYVVMMGSDRSRVYDTALKPVWELPPKSFGHGDLCLLADGTEALVYDGADHALNGDRNLNIANLDTRKIGVGVRVGWRTTPHVSCRNFGLPGWALVSTQGPDPKYPNLDFEIFWVKLDGSREVRRVAHHHSSRATGGYFAEQHAVPSRDGERIVFASNWGGKTICDYVVETGK